MNILITGASGFIGSALCKKLADSGNTIHAFGRSVHEAELLLHSGIKLFKGDILDEGAIKNAIKDCQQVYHLAGYVKVQAKDPSTFYKVNVDGTINVLNACLQEGIKKVVFTSTCGTFGPSGIHPTTEDTPRVPIFFTHYARSKFQAELKALEYLNKGLEVVVVSPTRVFGPGPLNESNPVCRLIKLYLRGKWRIIPEKGENLGNYAFIDDVVDGHIKAMEQGRTDENYLLGGENLSLNDLVRQIRKETGVKKRMFKIKLSLLLPFIKIQEIIFKILNKPPFVTTSWLKRLKDDLAFSSKKAEKELDYQITPFSTGLKTTINWMRKMGYIKY
ncbi:NAD-dependent epimerase/dehydratase family protein [soil metagenome]